jgi:hypothetical protein
VASLVDRAIMLSGSRRAERRMKAHAAICNSSDARGHGGCPPITACDNFAQRPTRTT